MLMKKIIILGVLVLALFLVSCASTEEVSDEEIEASLEDLSDEQLLDVATGEESDGTAIVGEAYKRDSSRYRSSAKTVLSNRLSKTFKGKGFEVLVDGKAVRINFDDLLRTNPLAEDDDDDCYWYCCSGDYPCSGGMCCRG